MQSRPLPKIGIEVECEINDGDRPRLILSDPKWKELYLCVCVHGEKLRWTCDECNEFFERSPIPDADHDATASRQPKKLEAWTDQSGSEIIRES